MAYLTKSKKSVHIAKLIEDAIEILVSVGIPVADKTDRSLERIAMALLAVAGVTKSWTTAKGYDEQRFLKTRDIINFHNANFEEAISSG